MDTTHIGNLLPDYVNVTAEKKSAEQSDDKMIADDWLDVAEELLV